MLVHASQISSRTARADNNAVAMYLPAVLAIGINEDAIKRSIVAKLCSPFLSPTKHYKITFSFFAP
jgi:hypothetical protein